jgi:hypothetical protein
VHGDSDFFKLFAWEKDNGYVVIAAWYDRWAWQSDLLHLDVDQDVSKRRNDNGYRLHRDTSSLWSGRIDHVYRRLDKRFQMAKPAGDGYLDVLFRRQYRVDDSQFCANPSHNDSGEHADVGRHEHRRDFPYVRVM